MEGLMAKSKFEPVSIAGKKWHKNEKDRVLVSVTKSFGNKVAGDVTTVPIDHVEALVRQSAIAPKEPAREEPAPAKK
jgi:hypothetical protein